MVCLPRGTVSRNVALRKESVDRNKNTPQNKLASMRSLSARRAWIEIMSAFDVLAISAVALRKESVDRNANAMLNA